MSDKPTRPSTPRGLGSVGRRLWRELVADLPLALEFDRRDLAILEAACRQADLNSDLEQAIAEDGTMIAGAAGQRRLNSAVTEARNGRLALARLLGELGLDEPTTKLETAASRRGRRAAQARWGTLHAVPGQATLDGRGG